MTNRYSDELKTQLENMGMQVYGPSVPLPKAGYTHTLLYELVAYNFNLDAAASIRPLRKAAPEWPVSIAPPQDEQAESSGRRRIDR